MTSSPAKGTKRTLTDRPEDSLTRSDTGGPSPFERIVKKPKRAEIRTCPVCEDAIPVRLLASHAEFELQRVEDICCTRIEPDDLIPWEQIEEEELNSAGPSKRGAALKARRSLNPSQGRVSLPSSAGRKPDLLAQVSKTLKLVRRHRRERHVNLKELSKGELETDGGNPLPARQACPVCQTSVVGDEDVLDAHVDACLTHAVRTAVENGADLEADGLEEYEAGGERRIRISGSVNFRGAGFDVRNPQHIDVEDDIDIDGDDAAVFGDIQFTERDIIFPDGMNGAEDEEVRIDGDDEANDLSTAQQGKAGRTPRRVIEPQETTPKSKTSGVATSSDVSALGSVTCRICLDPYIEPTVSTGCWHTCCKTCWLRCLGTTKLCPICKRITAAGDLRRIYL